MAYDEALADRVLAEVEVLEDIRSRKMFGGLAVMWQGNMLAGVMGDQLMVRVGADRYEALLAEPGAAPMDFTGRPMRGILVVAPDVLSTADELSVWIARALTFVGTLPPK
ncbi:MAG: TfoX/Sxy family protein [Actinobacteria bacterium]|nr:TfoX/Sxy family protein [Actinomycetota bacterium]